MKIVNPKYEILTDISEGGIKELQQIERVARVCYKSEDKITPDGESAKKLVGFLVKQGHEAMLEHSQLSVLFTCDRGVANELVRHRIASFAQESTRYCNYSKEKFGGELTFIRPYYIDVTDTDKKRESAEYTPGSTWLDSCESAEILYKDMIALGMRPEQARCVLPLCLKTEIVVTANYREWRNIFKLRTPVAAHPQMRELMCPLLMELQKKIPVVFDDLNSHRFMSMRDIEASLADKFNCSLGVADRRMRYALDMAEYRSGGVNVELENLKSTYDIKVLSLKKFLYAAGRSLMMEVSVGNDRR